MQAPGPSAQPRFAPGVTEVYADHFPGGGDSDDESSVTHSVTHSPKSFSCPRVPGLVAASQTTPQLPSMSHHGAAVQRSLTFTEPSLSSPTLPRSASAFALARLQLATEKTIEASLSVHDVSVYGRMLASSEQLPQIQRRLIDAAPAAVGEPPERAPLTPGLYAQIFFSVVKSYVGPAILYLPHAFLNAGMLYALLLLPFLGALTTSCFYHLTQCHVRAAGAPTYGDLAALALGRPGRVLLTVCLASAQLATCTSYFMFVASNLRDTATSFGLALPPDPQLIPLLMPVFAPLCCLPLLRHLAPTNILADLLILAGLSYVAVYALAQLADAPPAAAPVEWVQPPASLLLFVGTSCFTFEGGGLMVPIVASLDPSQKHHFGPIFLQAMLLVCTLFTGFGTLCYACFGGGVIMPVTLNIHSSREMGAALRLGYSLAVVCTYPLQMLPVADMVEAALGAPPCLLRQPSARRRLIARFALIGLTCTVAVFGASQFDHFISLVGVLCAVPLGFLCPALIYLRLCDDLGVASAFGRATARLTLLVAPLFMLGGLVSVVLSWNGSR